MTGLRLPPFRIIHAAYVASDFEAGKRRLAALFGADSFQLLFDVPIPVPGGEALINVAVADVNGVTLEIIQPAGGKDHVYRQVLPDDPEDIAFHHFATRIDSEAEWDLANAAATSHGLDMPVWAEADPGASYLYLDTRPQLGHMLEFLWFRGQGAEAAIFDSATSEGPFG